MKKRLITSVTAIILLMSMTVFFTGCFDRDIMEEPDITVKYLTGEYAEQLDRDGAECTLATVKITQDGENYSAVINSMAIVESSMTDEGYYIADMNVSETCTMDADTRATYIKDTAEGPEVVSFDEFVQLTMDDTSDPLKAGEERLYNVYTYDGIALLFLAQEMPE